MSPFLPQARVQSILREPVDPWEPTSCFAGVEKRVIDVRLWMPLLLTAIPTAILWRRNRRPPPGHCRQCGYNLTGNVSRRCPECGETIQRE